MRKVVLAAVLAAVGFVVVAQAEEAAVKTPAATTEAPAVKAAVMYVCADCKIGATEAGKCAKCGKDMVAMHVLDTKDGKVMCCACGADCKCKVDEKDATKCGCGKAVVTVPAPEKK
jgi:hypothetical protein